MCQEEVRLDGTWLPHYSPIGLFTKKKDDNIRVCPGRGTSCVEGLNRALREATGSLEIGAAWEGIKSNFRGHDLAVL